MKIIPTFLRNFIANVCTTKHRQLVNSGAKPEHISVYNEAKDEYYKNNWKVKQLFDLDKELIIANVSPEQLKACNEVMIQFHKNEVDTRNLTDVLVKTLLLKATPDQIKLLSQGLVGTSKEYKQEYDAGRDIAGGDYITVEQSVINKNQLIFFSLVSANPNTAQCELLKYVHDIKSHNVWSGLDWKGFVEAYIKLLNKKPTNEQFQSFKEFIKVYMEDSKKREHLVELTNHFTDLIPKLYLKNDWESYGKAFSIYTNNKWYLDDFIHNVADLAGRKNFDKQLDVYISALKQIRYLAIEKSGDGFPRYEHVVKTFNDIFFPEIANKDLPSKYWDLLSTVLKKEANVENKVFRTDWDVIEFTKSFVDLIKLSLNKEHLENYHDIISFIYKNCKNISETTPIIKFVLAKPSKELIEIYKKALSLYTVTDLLSFPVSQDRLKTLLIGEFNRLAKANPPKKLLEILNDNMTTTKSFIGKQIIKCAALVEPFNTYEANKDKLTKLSSEMKQYLEDEWKEELTDVKKLDEPNKVDPLLNEVIIKNLYPLSLSDKEWDLYNQAILYDKGSTYLNLKISLTSDFVRLIKSKPTQEEWLLYEDVFSYYKTNKLKSDRTIWNLAYLFEAKPEKEKLDKYKEWIVLFQEKDLSLTELVKLCAQLAKPGNFNKYFNECNKEIKLALEDEALTKDLDVFCRSLTQLIDNDCLPEHIKLWVEVFDYHTKNHWSVPGEMFVRAVQDKVPMQLLRNYRNSLVNGIIKSQEESKKLLTEFRYHSAIYRILRQEGDIDAARTLLQNEAKSDELPINLYMSSSKHKILNPEAIKIQTETERVVKRSFDKSYGFSALTFDSKRSPTKEPALLARFGNDVGDIEYINAKDISLFPGKGFTISDFDLNKILVPDENNTEDPHHLYKEAWPWAKDVFDDFPKTEFVFTRGFMAVLNKDKKYILNGIPYSYLVVNNHHHNKGCDTAYLVPTKILEEKLKDTKVPYKDIIGFSKNHKDINENGLKIEDLIGASDDNAPILNLGWGTNFGGGLCNAYPLDSKPYFEWEKELRPQIHHTKDFWERVHKSHITGTYETSMSRDPKFKELLKPLRQAHDDVYKITDNYQNLYDLFRLYFSMWKKGFTVGEKEITEEDLFQELEPQNLEQDDNDFVYNPNSLRMLNEAYKWHEGRSLGIEDKNYYPVLVITDTLDYWSQPKSPIMLDTYDMMLYTNGKKIPLNQEGVDDIEKEIWYKLVMPQAKDSIKDLRFYDRRDLDLLGGNNQ